MRNGVGDMIRREVRELRGGGDGGIWIRDYEVGIDYYENKSKEVSDYWGKDIKGL